MDSYILKENVKNQFKKNKWQCIAVLKGGKDLLTKYNINYPEMLLMFGILSKNSFVDRILENSNSN